MSNVQNAVANTADFLTVEDVKRSLPPSLRPAATAALVQKINSASADPLIAEKIRENFVSYTSVLKDGRFKTEDYLSAVTYVSYKLMGLSNMDAWIKTFPGRHTQLVARGADKKEISAHVAGYHRGKLVNQIMEQTMVPTWVLNQDVYQRAINIGLDIALNSKNDMARASAVNTLLSQLKRPEVIKAEIDVNVNNRGPVDDLEAALMALAQKQREAIQSGVVTAKELVGQRLVEGEVEDAEFDEVDPDPDADAPEGFDPFADDGEGDFEDEEDEA